MKYRDRFGVVYTFTRRGHPSEEVTRRGHPSETTPGEKRSRISGDCGCAPAKPREAALAKPAPKEESKLSNAAAVGLIAGVYGGIALINHYVMKPEPVVEPDAREAFAEKLRTRAEGEVRDAPEKAADDAEGAEETDEEEGR